MPPPRERSRQATGRPAAMMRWCIVAAGVALMALASGGSARANGRYPSAGQIVAAPNDPMRVAIRTTYGVLTSADLGRSWSWSCESAVGFQGFEDPMMAIGSDGTLMVALAHGLSVTGDLGCQWSAVATFANRNVIDVAVDRRSPARAVLLVSTVQPDDSLLTQVWQSTDDARSWARVGADLPSTFVALTIDVVPSDPRRLYVSGHYSDATGRGALLRSDDGGATWLSFDIPGSGSGSLPYIGAVDPLDANTVYVRSDGETSDALLVSRDGGASWNAAFSAANLYGLALSPDGQTIAAGGPSDGLWTAPTATLTFTKVSSVGTRCLFWNAAGLVTCADELSDGFTAGLSVDQGRTFSPLMHANALCPTPVQCASTSTTGMMCPAFWPGTAASLGLPNACYGTLAADGGVDGGGGGNGVRQDIRGGCSLAREPPAGAGPWLAALALLGVPTLVRTLRQRGTRHSSR